MIFYENENDEMNLFFQNEDDFPRDFYSSGDDNKINRQDSNEMISLEDNHFNGYDFDACQKYPNSPCFFFEGQSSFPTEPSSKDHHLNQKRCREETEYYEQNDNALVEEKNEEKIEVKECEEKMDENEEQKEEKAEEESKTIKKEKKCINNNINNNIKSRGRRKKDESYDDEPEHDKFKPDNIIQKIKTFYFRYVLELLNNSLKDNHYKFYPLDKTLNVNLKKDFNEDLMKRTIYDIFMNSDLNERHKNGDYSNKNLINKILEEKSEIKTIKILKMKYTEVLDYIRQNDRKNFLEKIRAKEQKNKGQQIDLYMKEVSFMLDDYEKWFGRKNGRNVNRNKKKKIE